MKNAFTELDKVPFWAAAQRCELVYQRCNICGYVQFYPRALCRVCRGNSLRYENSAGKGRIYSFSIVSWTPVEAFKTPYAIALVDLLEDFRMMTNIVNVDFSKIHIGMPVRVQFVSNNSGLILPNFEPDSDVGI
jgi:uncharacterized protein